MAYADTLNTLGSDALAPSPGAMAPPADAPAATPGPGRYQATLDALNAALAPDGGDSPGTVTVPYSPGYAGTLAHLNAALNSPPGTRIIMGAAAPVSAGLTPRGAIQPDPDSVPPSARVGAARAPDAFDPQAPDADAAGGARPLTIRAGQPDAPNPDGPLANAPGDGWAAGAAKGAATGAIKGAGDAVGFVGGLGGLADYLIARGESAITGKPVDQVQAAHAARRKAVEADMDSTPLGRLAVATDPTNLLPAPDDVSGPILAKTGAYAPTSEPGRLAQAGVEAAVGAFGPGGGMVSPGTAGKAVAGALARQAPAMAAAGAASQGAVDATGSPLAGLAAGLVVPAAGEAVGAGVRGAAKLAAPVAGGSKLLNAAPVVGPALQAGREAAVAGKILGQSSDPAALRAWAAGQPDAPEVPNSPRTLAGSVGDDSGLYQAEKDARNVNNARPTATVTVDGQSYGGQSFNGIDRAQSDAQVAALQGGRQDADVFRPGAMIRSRMDAIDAAAQQAEDRLNAAHADVVSGIQSAGQGFAADQQAGLAQRTADRQQAGADFADQTRTGLADRTAGRTQSAADDAGQAQTARDDAHAALVQGFADARDRQLQVAQAAAAPLGEPVNAENIGSTLRGAVEQVRSGAKDLHRDLYRAVDPDGTLALVATPVGDKAGAIMDGLRSNGAELSPAEAPLFRRAAALPDVATYGTLHALDTDLSGAMSAERRTAGETSAWARLSALKGSVKSAMTNAADNQAAQANALDKANATDLLAERAANDRAATQADKASTSGALSNRAVSDRAAVAQSRADTSAGISATRGIVRDAKATPAARFANGGGTGVASTEVENAVGSFLKTGTTGATRLRGLVQSVQSDPEALAGLQKAGTDWIVRNHLNADGTLSGAKLISFVKQNADSLRELYPHDQVSMMGALARDAEAGARWRTTTAIKGGSDSVKNLLAAASEGGHGSHTTLGMVAVEAVAQGFEHGGLQGAAYGGMGAAALYMMNAMRQAGIRRTSDLYMAALADPELARMLISKMPTKADSGTMIGFSRALKRSLILGPMAVGEARASRAGAAR